MGFFSKWFNFGKNQNSKDSIEVDAKAKTNLDNKHLSDKEVEEIIVYSPVNGQYKILKDVSDPVFAEEMTGKGIAIVPNSDEKVVFSPLQGKIKVAFPTGHAYGITTKLGPEILVHIGIDTVELDGKGFVKKVEVDKEVTKDTELCDLDIATIKENEKETDIIVIATNDSIEGFEIKICEKLETDKEIKVGDPIFKIIKKV